MTVIGVRALPGAAELRHRRRARRPRRPLGFLLSMLIERLIYLGILGGLVVEVTQAGVARIEAGGGVPDLVRTSVTQLTAAVLALVCVVLLAKALLAFGPLYAGSPVRTWLLSTPVDRGALLRGHLAAATAVGAVVGALIGFVFLAVTRLSVPVASWVVCWAAAGVVLAGLCVLAQAGERPVATVQRWLSVAAYGLVGVAVAVLALRPGLTLTGLESAGPVPFTVAAAVALAAAVATAEWARRGLGAMTRGKVSSGAELATATHVSVLSLDVTMFWSIVLERRARAVARVRPAAIRGNRFIALVKSDLARIRRMPTGFFMWAALIFVPYGAYVVGLAAFLPALHTVTAFAAVDRLAAGLRVVSRSPAIRRALGGSDLTLTLTFLTVPAAGAVVWSAVTWALVPGLPLLTAAVSAVGALAVTYRVATRPPLDYSSPLVDVGLFGPTPLGLILQLVRGPALLAGLALLQTVIAG
ncbi:DUF6297 family protein [Herbidospora yilanensis]|uniref:DUF6297 family protein n=1 Tax=Herbidospora yilanensis TaxID=354426 RepID=UPI000781E90C|nr:DUF6297 family protein [Herbidospora yilanensis]